MRDHIQVGYQVFVAGGGEEIGAVRRDRRSLMVRPKKLAEIVKSGRIEGESAVSV